MQAECLRSCFNLLTFAKTVSNVYCLAVETLDLDLSRQENKTTFNTMEKN